MNRYIDEGVAELVPGVLFIDEVFSQIKFFFHSTIDLAQDSGAVRIPLFNYKTSGSYA